MVWYYSDNQGKQAGPVSNEQFEAAVQSGAITANTLVWKEGFPEWVKFSSLGATDEHGNPGVRCSECAKVFAPDDVINLSGSWVCAGCKPVYVQKLKEGIATGSSSNLWRSGRKLVALVESELPNRCIKCNETTNDKPIKRRLYWHHPAFYVAIVSPIIYVLIALIARKSAKTTICLCHKHRSSRRNAILLSWLLVIGGFVAIPVGMVNEMTWLVLAGVAMIIGGIIYGIARGRTVYATKITKKNVWIAGCKPEFLADFPEWTE